MRFFGRSLIGLLLLALTLGVLALAGQTVVGAFQARLADAGPGGAAREREFTAAVVTVQPGVVVPELTVFGEVKARRMLELRAPGGGRVIWLAEGFEDGAAVAAGQALVRLDPAEATTARDLAQSDLAKVEAEVGEADRALVLARDALAAVQAQAALRALALARQNDLRSRGLGSEADVEAAALAASSADQAVLSARQALSQAETRVDLAATAVSRQRITLAEAERALAETEIRAGFAGRLSGVAVTTGGLVSPNERLADLIDLAALEVSFRLSTAQYARLSDATGGLLAAPVQIALDASGSKVVARGHLSRVGAAVGEGQTGRLVYAALDANPGAGSGDLLPGDFVSVIIAEPALEGVFALPAAALGTGDRVLVLGPEDRLEEHPVQVVLRQGDSVILRAEALAGREVVSARSPLLGAGIRIRPTRGDTAAVDPEPVVALTPERRAKLVAFVEANSRMPAEAKARMLEQLAQDQVPVQVVERLEQRMGG
ncbi:efflux RND transporter periplasmic adaptor subunit [Rhodobacter ferrooxidans]|uniref:Efflux transporter, RND family, MFP subunit n=1 Tax=Rhodobacter ferrooxidans TaxID=371731 RepID=C8S1K5_9RHOB|nr:HlyD family efflux transporter periplasmic adaptor subunit [Rhodobacter sp. SW2]EEW25178.1 efflux transporter, RND family, MFP subunit [Rhodobacter sp. SW2]